ncbi:MAG: HsmA family protein [Candidatus Paceibacterota bacterium]|jgi:uncharacterized repeat protein (TIGR03987 family)
MISGSVNKKLFFSLLEVGDVMAISMIFIFSALALYTSSIFLERHVGRLKIWIVVMFTCGFASDLIGTSIMFFLAKTKFSLALHSVCGYSALLIMFCHLVWAILAVKNVGNCQRYFTKFSVYAWAVWITAFISGIPKVSSIILKLFL